MKLNPLSSALLAFAGIALVSTVRAANPGDLILSIAASGGQGVTTDYEVDLGSVYNFVGQTTPVNLLNYVSTTQLGQIYGSNFLTRTDLVFSLEADNDGSTVSGQVGRVGAISDVNLLTAPTGETPSSFQGFTGSKINGEYSGLNSTTDANFTAGTAPGSYVVVASDPNSYSSESGGSSSNYLYGQGSFASAEALETPLGIPNVEDVYLFGYGNVAAAKFVDGFEFGAPALTPEPSTYAMFGLGAVLLAWFVRRRNLVG